MNQQQFLAALENRLNGLPQGDIEKTLEYYKEMIEDRIEDGMTEEEAVQEMDPLDEIASQTLFATPFPELVKARAKAQRTLNGWEIVLLILGSPLWISLLLTAVILLLSLYVVLWSVILSLYAVGLSFAVAGVGGILGGVVMAFAGFPNQALFYVGAGLICAGTAILLFFGFRQITRQILKLSKKILLWVKSWFIAKGDKK